ncbi:MAG: hypothetical protein WC347_08575, partial [Smithellaceae bacterium]
MLWPCWFARLLLLILSCRRHSFRTYPAGRPEEPDVQQGKTNKNTPLNSSIASSFFSFVLLTLLCKVVVPVQIEQSSIDGFIFV